MFPTDENVGLGIQLVSIINSIKKYLAPHIWYGADVEAIGKGTKKYKLNTTYLNRIGTDLEFTEYCSEIEQFIWGVFLCIDRNFSIQNIQDIELETEDIPFRSVNANGILIEIRAFDTTYFGLYSENLDLIKNISKTYNVDFQKKEII